MDLYVYYRVPAERSEELRLKLQSMQRWLSHEYGIVSALKRRPEEKDGLQTWMEIYLAAPDGFSVMLERAVAQAGLAALIDGQRHTEFFVDVSACA